MQKIINSGESVEFATAILSCIGDGVISTDIDGKILYMNKVAEDIIEKRAYEVVGQDFDQVFRFLYADDLMPLESPIQSTLKGFCF